MSGFIKKNNLVFNFQETNIYSKKDWLKEFIIFCMNIKTIMWVNKTSNIQVFDVPIDDSNSKINEYKKENSKYAINYATENLNLSFSGNKNINDLSSFYEDYKILFKIKNYKYIYEKSEDTNIIYFNSDFIAYFENNSNVSFSTNSNFAVFLNDEI
ncbi:hypothetical protein SERIO_v1c08420 [Spiroplasma eriocheiris]|uniref:Uncharacterized protein n=2 Tax=Spiroplasma eriocheiris TaxID=315358 RepID=A0A0H3XMV8_9MOLU|nr:hypothetical protein SERIO_v1c08420 [Spiroplasma eriocheiris]